MDCYPIVKVSQIDSNTFDFQLTYSDHVSHLRFDKLHVLKILDALNFAGL